MQALQLSQFQPIQSLPSNLILRAYSKLKKKQYNISLYKIHNSISHGTALTFFNKLAKKNSKYTHKNLMQYEHFQLVSSTDLHFVKNPNGKYLALIKQNKSLTLPKWKQMKAKQKVEFMLAIAKAVKSLHKNNLSHLQLNLKDIFLNRKKKVVIDSIFNSEIKILTTKPKEQKSISQYHEGTQMQYDIWDLAVIFIDIMIQGKVKVDWSNPQKMIKSLKTLLKCAKSTIFPKISTIITKMLRLNEEEQISISRVVRKLRKLNELSQEEIVYAGKPFTAKITLLKRTLIVYKDLSVDLNHQRIVVLDPYEIFITYYQEKELLVFEMTHIDHLSPLLISHFTIHNLPEELQSKYTNIYSLFLYLQALDHNLFQISKFAYLSFPHP